MPLITSPNDSIAGFQISRNSEALNNNFQRLSTGSRLAIPSDDAAGVAVSGRLNAALARLDAASDNTQSVVSVAQTTDGFLNTIQSGLTRLSELSLRATNGVFSDTDRAALSTEFNSLRDQLNDFAANASFNGTPLFQDSTITTAINSEGQTADFELTDLGSATSLGLDGLDISTLAGAQNAIGTINGAIDQLSTRRAEVNADISRFNFFNFNIQTESINTAAANSRIEDLDVARESTSRATNDILLNAAVAVQAQANASRGTVLALLQ